MKGWMKCINRIRKEWKKQRMDWKSRRVEMQKYKKHYRIRIMIMNNCYKCINRKRK